jgi:hypothetical protein
MYHYISIMGVESFQLIDMGISVIQLSKCSFIDMGNKANCVSSVETYPYAFLYSCQMKDILMHGLLFIVIRE